MAAYVGLLSGSLFNGAWLVDEAGGLIPYDYVNPYSAGRLALGGLAPDAYRYAAHKAAQVAALGHGFDGYFPWPYPPVSLLVVAPFAILPYLPSFGLWTAATLGLYLAAMRRVAGPGALVLLAALAWPATVWNLSVGQNGFLTAALLNFGLAWRDERPYLAGLAIGLLTFKPQFGLLIPLALLAGGHGRVAASATATALVLALASWAAFGAETWAAFLQSLAVNNEAVMVQGRGDFAKLQTVFGIVRSATGSAPAAWMAQIAVTIASAVAVVVAWRRPMPADTRSAILAVACLLATPYAFMYDLVILAVPIAFLSRRGFDRIELRWVVLAGILVLAAPFLPPCVAFGAIVAVAILTVRRAASEFRGCGGEPGRACVTAGASVRPRSEISL